jgi:hypothetical protein
MEDKDMLKRKQCKKLCFLFLAGAVFFSCGKKEARPNESANAAQSGGLESGETNVSEKGKTQLPVHEGKAVLPIYYGDVKQNGLDLDDLKTIITIDTWGLVFSGESPEINFKLDGTYSIRLYTWGRPSQDPFAFGKYEIKGDNVIMRYPAEIQEAPSRDGDDFAPEFLEWLFAGKNVQTLVYDKTYKDYSVATCLRYENRMFINNSLKSPYGEEYENNGIAVIKCHSSETHVEILENLKMREYPDINADTVTLTALKQAYDEEGKPYWEWITGNTVKEGEHYTYDEKTVKQDTIDGITAPWYRISIALDLEIESRQVWVFGGYLKEYTPEEIEEWRNRQEVVSFSDMLRWETKR